MDRFLAGQNDKLSRTYLRPYLMNFSFAAKSTRNLPQYEHLLLKILNRAESERRLTGYNDAQRARGKGQPVVSHHNSRSLEQASENLKSCINESYSMLTQKDFVDNQVSDEDDESGICNSMDFHGYGSATDRQEAEIEDFCVDLNTGTTLNGFYETKHYLDLFEASDDSEFGGEQTHCSRQTIEDGVEIDEDTPHSELNELAALGVSAPRQLGRDRLAGAQRLRASRNQSPNTNRVQPYKILDAPGLQDDFYLNLLDWSSENMLAVALGSSVFTWQASSGQVSKIVDLGENSLVCSVKWLGTGSHLLIGCSRGVTQLWAIDPQPRVVRVFAASHSGRVGVIATKGHLIATGSRDRRIALRDARDRAGAFGKLEDHKQEVCGLDWCPDTDVLASGGNDNRLVVWDTGSRKLRSRHFHSAAVKALAWSPHKAGLLASAGGTADKTIRLWDTLVSNLQPSSLLTCEPQLDHSASPHLGSNSVSFAPNGISALRAHSISPLLAGSPIYPTSAATASTTAAAVDNGDRTDYLFGRPEQQYSAQGRSLAPNPPLTSFGSPEDDRDTGERPIFSLDTGSQVCNLVWSKTSQHLVSTHGYSQNHIAVWQYNHQSSFGSRVASVHPSSLSASSFLFHGAAEQDPLEELITDRLSASYRTAGGKDVLELERVLTGHTLRVLYLSLSPCGQSIVTGAGDQTLRFWQLFGKTPLSAGLTPSYRAPVAETWLGTHLFR